MKNVSRGLKVFSLAVTASLLFTGCSIGDSTKHAQESTAPETQEPKFPSLREADLGNMTWVDPMAPTGTDNEVTLVNSKAKDEFSDFELGEVVYLDLNGDDVEDAVAPFLSTSGNAYWENYIAWIATENGPVQVLDPIAYSHICGARVAKAEPGKNGIQITEYLRSQFQDSACAVDGPIKRVRTVAVKQYPGDDEYYLVRVDAEPGYGGYCDPEEDGDFIAAQMRAYAAPNVRSRIVLKPNEMFGYMTGAQSQGHYSKDKLWVKTSISLKDDKGRNGLSTRCVWMPTIDNPAFVEGEAVLGENGEPIG